MDAAVHEVEEPLYDLHADPRKPSREGVRAQQQRGPDVFPCERASHADGVAAHEVPLEFADLLLRNRDVLQLSEPGLDPIREVPFPHEPLHRFARSLHGPLGGGPQDRGLPSACDRDDMVDRERVSVDGNHRPAMAGTGEKGFARNL